MQLRIKEHTDNLECDHCRYLILNNPVYNEDDPYYPYGREVDSSNSNTSSPPNSALNHSNDAADLSV
jgi:hypothetical protein